jgi:hypothetical protein
MNISQVRRHCLRKEAMAGRGTDLPFPQVVFLVIGRAWQRYD